MLIFQDGQVKLVNDTGVVGKIWFLTVARTHPTVGKFASDLEYLNNFRAGAKSEHYERLLNLLRFFQQAPRYLTLDDTSIGVIGELMRLSHLFIPG